MSIKKKINIFLRMTSPLVMYAIDKFKELRDLKEEDEDEEEIEEITVDDLDDYDVVKLGNRVVETRIVDYEVIEE